MDLIPLDFHTPTPFEALDFGRIVQHSPSAVLKPKTPQDISLLLKCISSSPHYNNLTIGASGTHHSIHGQAQALDGIVIEMTSLPNSIKINKSEVGSDGEDCYFVDVSAGALWVEVLEETLKHGLTPRSWTDYLFLTVGGTLSVGGISGQTFKYGPQICNVLELDVVTGRGDFVTCSKGKNSDLFNGVLGGLGQFGIIIRARVILEIAPKMVKCIKVFYDDFSRFARDQELLISMKEVDYVEGFIKLRWETSFTVGYTIEMAIYYNEATDIEQTVGEILLRLRICPSVIHSFDISYFDFLNRVGQEEQKLRRTGLWEVPHPWLNIFVPRFQISRFKDLLLETISATPPNGPIIIYPIHRHKWDLKMSTVIPSDDIEEDILYVVSMLRSAIPSSCLQTLLNQNQKIINVATSGACINHDKTRVSDSTAVVKDRLRLDEKSEWKNVIDSMEGGHGMGAKQYIPYCKDQSEWRVHFGEEWERFEALKSKFDPLNILGPGQMIFKRKNILV